MSFPPAPTQNPSLVAASVLLRAGPDTGLTGSGRNEPTAMTMRKDRRGSLRSCRGSSNWATGEGSWRGCQLRPRGFKRPSPMQPRHL